MKQQFQAKCKLLKPWLLIHDLVTKLISVIKNRKNINSTSSSKNKIKGKGNHSFFEWTSLISSLITTGLAIFVFFNLSNINDLREYIKSQPNSRRAAEEWKIDLSNVRIGNSQQYVEEILGVPKLIDEINDCSSSYVKTIYSNSYFSLICIYCEDSSLLGYLIIGNDSNFNFRNYRCGFTMFDYTINEAEKYCEDHGVYSYILLQNFESNRLECNSYYFECNYQHSMGAVAPFLIGYGVCDIGALNSYPDFYKAVRTMYQSGSQSEPPWELRDKTLNDEIRNMPVNTFLIMSDSIPKTSSFVAEHLLGFALGMGRDEYANLQSDYEECLSSFAENLNTGYCDSSNDVS